MVSVLLFASAQPTFPLTLVGLVLAICFPMLGILWGVHSSTRYISKIAILENPQAAVVPSIIIMALLSGLLLISIVAVAVPARKEMIEVVGYFTSLNILYAILTRRAFRKHSATTSTQGFEVILK